MPITTEVNQFSRAGTKKLREIAENTAVYTDFLKFQGRIFKHNAVTALEFFAQKPDSSFIATKRQWAAAGYEIKDGGDALCFIDENGEQRELYDFSQVEGDFAPAIWLRFFCTKPKPPY